MKKLVIIVALVMFLKPILPVADYIVNYDYIAKVLCENKNKPEMKCNGKCQLMKELAKASEQEKPIAPSKKIQIQETEVLFFQEINPMLPEQSYCKAKKFLGDHYANLYFHLNSGTVFHPPIFSV
ncbi:hypothetical protein [Flavobacterium sp. J49]|uniref:hypothetical protein n=1 Tax=Flavobacterium sp. J49 TaxID=2718534 RepID=UPI00293C0A62|nr:hypothetical protein [Flavobacterium sp. J49]